MWCDSTWLFTQANIRTPILKAGFLAHFNLLVHMNMRMLLDNTTSICLIDTCTHYNMTGISVTICHNCEFIYILNHYAEISQPFKKNIKTRAISEQPHSPQILTHNDCHCINMTMWKKIFRKFWMETSFIQETAHMSHYYTFSWNPKA